MNSFAIPPLRFDLPSRQSSQPSNGKLKKKKKPLPVWLQRGSTSVPQRREGGSTTGSSSSRTNSLPSSTAIQLSSSTLPVTWEERLSFDSNRLCELELELKQLEREENNLICQLNETVNRQQSVFPLWQRLSQQWSQLHQSNVEWMNEGKSPMLDFESLEREALAKQREAEASLVVAEDDWKQVTSYGNWLKTAEQHVILHCQRIHELMTLTEQLEKDRHELLQRGANTLEIERKREESAVEMTRLSEWVIAKEFKSQETPLWKENTVSHQPKERISLLSNTDAAAMVKNNTVENLFKNEEAESSAIFDLPPPSIGFQSTSTVLPFNQNHFQRQVLNSV